MNRIYADNAATTPISATARRVLLETMDRAWGNPSSLHTTGQEAAEVLLKARQDVAKCLNAAREREITFTSGGSEADNQALLSGAMLVLGPETTMGSKDRPSAPFLYRQ